MGIDVGSNSIAEIYYGNNAISEVYYGNDLVWSANVPDVNYIFRDIDSNGKLTVATGNLDSADDIKKLKTRGLSYAFYNSSGLTGSVVFNNLTIINKAYVFYRTFYQCSNITSVSFPNLQEISGGSGLYSCFENCAGITSVSFPKLETLSQNYAMGRAFYGCRSLTTVSFPKLSTILFESLYETFRLCTNLTSLSFPALHSGSFGSTKQQFRTILENVSGCTVHFPTNLQVVIGSWNDIINGCGGTNTTILFDLPATE